MQQTVWSSIAAGLGSLGLLACTAHAPAPDAGADPGAPFAVRVPGSGVYSRPISTDSPAAQQFFDQGLRLSWGFYFPEAIASHLEAARLDPDHPMPYWGLAQAMGPNPNSRYRGMPDDPKGEAAKAIARARALLANANAVERDLIETLSVLYDRAAAPDAADRDRAYLAAARRLHEKYPDDPDVGALYAAAYMSIGRWDYWDAEGRPKSETAAVAAALERVLTVVPGHPGANHLYIHLLEASSEPERALPMADRLEATMPIAGHIVHMPAHIYVRVGQYAKAIASNVRSQQADRDFAAVWGDLPLPDLGTYPLSHRIHTPHAVDFIRYAATVQGSYATAIDAATRSAERVTAETLDGMSAQKRVAARWLVRKTFGQWDELVGHEPEFSGRPYLDGLWRYALGSAYLGVGDLERARAALQELAAIASAPDADRTRVGPTPTSELLEQAALGLEGEIRQFEGDLEGAIDAFERAVAVEDRNRYTEPPDWPQPMRLYLGAALLEANRAEDAEAVYRRDLRWNRNNGWSLFGLARSLALQGRAEEAAAVRARFESAWQHADVELTRSRF